MAATTTFRTSNANMVKAAQAAKRAQAAHKVQRPNNQAILANLHALVGKVHGDHNHAIRSLAAHMDNPDNGPEAVYNTLNRTFKNNRPNYTQWLIGHK